MRARIQTGLRRLARYRLKTDGEALVCAFIGGLP
jgi:hypothetical protein